MTWPEFWTKTSTNKPCLQQMTTAFESTRYCLHTHWMSGLSADKHTSLALKDLHISLPPARPCAYFTRRALMLLASSCPVVVFTSACRRCLSSSRARQVILRRFIQSQNEHLKLILRSNVIDDSVTICSLEHHDQDRIAHTSDEALGGLSDVVLVCPFPSCVARSVWTRSNFSHVVVLARWILVWKTPPSEWPTSMTLMHLCFFFCFRLFFFFFTPLTDAAKQCPAARAKKSWDVPLARC